MHPLDEDSAIVSETEGDGLWVGVVADSRLRMKLL